MNSSDYYVKYQRLKEKYSKKVSDQLTDKLEYIFDNEFYVAKLRLFEFELTTQEFLYNILFHPFNLDAWLSKIVCNLLKLTSDKLLSDFNRISLTTVENDNSLGYIQNIRNFILWNVRIGNRVDIYGNSFNQSFIFSMNLQSTSLYNKYHKENCIKINETVYTLNMDITKHHVIQFLSNPFWIVDGKIQNTTQEFYSKKIINDNWEVTDSNLCIDGRTSDIQHTIVDDFLNPILQEQVVNLDNVFDIFYNTILCKDISDNIKLNVWDVVKKVSQKVRKSTSYLTNTIDDINKNVKTIIWKQAPPVYKNYENLIKDKRNVFTPEEITIINDSRIVTLHPTDLGLVLPMLFDNKKDLLPVIHLFTKYQVEFELPKILGDTINCQIENLSGKLHITYFGVHFLLNAKNREINLKKALSWDYDVCYINYLLLQFNRGDIFDLLDGNLTFAVLKNVIDYDSTYEIKLAFLLSKQYNNLRLMDFLDFNPDLMLDILLNGNMTIFPTNVQITQNQINNKIEGVEILPSYLYISYMAQLSEPMLDFKSVKNTSYKHFLFEDSIIQQIKIITRHLKQITRQMEYSQCNYKLTIERHQNYWDNVIIHNYLPLFRDVSLIFSLEEGTLSLSNKKVFWTKNSSRENFVLVTIPPDYHSYFISEFEFDIKR